MISKGIIAKCMFCDPLQAFASQSTEKMLQVSINQVPALRIKDLQSLPDTLYSTEYILDRLVKQRFVRKEVRI